MIKRIIQWWHRQWAEYYTSMANAAYHDMLDYQAKARRHKKSKFEGQMWD